MYEDYLPVGTKVLAPWAEIGFVGGYCTTTEGKVLVHFLKIKKNGEVSKRGHWLSAESLKEATFENAIAIIDGIKDKK
jgi:hypothetical protein